MEINITDKKQIFLGFLILFVIMYLGAIWYNFIMIGDLIEGFWTAPPGFCVDAGIDSFLLYIGARGYFNSYRPCYIIIQRDGKLFLNQPVEAKFAWDWLSIQNWRKCLDHSTVKYGSVCFKFDEETAFPSFQNVACYPTYGKMVLSKDDVICATLYRSAELTEQLIENQTKIAVSRRRENSCQNDDAIRIINGE